MLFTQIEFIVFFAAFTAAMALVRGVAKKYILLAASLYVYAYADYRMVLLLLSSTLVTYCIGKSISGSSSTAVQRSLLFAGIVLNLAALGTFKYLDFFQDTVRALLGVDSTSSGALGIILPLGISFYTFRFISYLVDIQRKKIQSPGLLDFLIYGTFFPIIIAGPISRATTFLPQLEKLGISADNLYKGFRLFAIGLFLKVFVADRIAGYVNFYFENYEVFNSATSWLAVLAYSVQIYCDFAGYSSMAIGAAQVMGIRIEENFNFPYLAANISDFWRRWHITLSTWIRDYLYIPLGGSRKGKVRKYVNLLFAMTLCGLWHGAALTFVFWGFLHGLLLVSHHGWKDLQNKLPWDPKDTVSTLSSFAAWLLTYICVVLAWVFFRSGSFDQAISILGKLFAFTGDGVGWYHPFAVFILLATGVVHILASLDFKFIFLPLAGRTTLTVLFILLWLVVVFHPTEFQPFVYNQF